MVLHRKRISKDKVVELRIPENLERLLNEAGQESFPASDPPAVSCEVISEKAPSREETPLQKTKAVS